MNVVLWVALGLALCWSVPFGVFAVLLLTAYVAAGPTRLAELGLCRRPVSCTHGLPWVRFVVGAAGDPDWTVTIPVIANLISGQFALADLQSMDAAIGGVTAVKAEWHGPIIYPFLYMAMYKPILLLSMLLIILFLAPLRRQLSNFPSGLRFSDFAFG